MSKEHFIEGKNYLLPENLNLTEVLTISKPDFKYSYGFFVYLINLIWEVPARNDRVDVIDRYVPFSSILLQKVNHGYKQHLDYLIETGILERNTVCAYIVKEKCRSFRLTEKYSNRKMVWVEINDDKFLKRIEKLANVDFKATRKYEYLWQWFDERLTIDVEAATQFCQEQISDLNKRNSALTTIRNLSNRYYWFNVDSFGQRLHTILTSLNSELKQFITYDGKPLVSVDIKNSQPYLAIKLITNLFPNPITNPITTTPNPRPIMLVNQVETLDIADVYKYIELVVSGKFYEFLIDELLANFGERYFEPQYRFNFDKGKVEFDSSKPRVLAKRIFYEVAFSKINEAERKEKKLFRKLFPNVLKAFELLKIDDYTALPCELQRLEAKVVLDKACKEIGLKCPQIPIFTCHDSIICTVGNEDYVEEVLTHHLVKEIGYMPEVEKVNWQKDNLKRAA